FLPPSLPPSFSQIVEDASEDAQHGSRPPSQRHARLLPLLPPLLLLLHRFSSRQLVLDSPYEPLPPPLPPARLPPSTPDPQNGNELSLRLHVPLAKRLLGLWKAFGSRLEWLPAQVAATRFLFSLPWPSLCFA
ncbi:hypothetical protein Naga_101997g1, partial [Nannochloropsis gaditana]